MTDIKEAKQLLDRYNQAMLNKSADQLADLYSVDAVHELPFAHSHAATMRGREGVRAAYAKGWGTSNVVVHKIENVTIHAVVDGNTFVVEEDLELINTNTNLEFVASTVLVMRIQNGELIHVRDYTDNLTIATALGRIPSVAK